MITVDLDDSNLRVRIPALNERTRQELKRAVMAGAIDLQAAVQKKLAGEVLHERTHHLHDSIHPEFESTPQGEFATVGTNVVYARIHEYGGPVSIREHLRTITMVFGQQVAPTQVVVRAHTANYPKRSFLRSALAEKAASLRERIEAAVRKAAAQ